MFERLCIRPGTGGRGSGADSLSEPAAGAPGHLFVETVRGRGRMGCEVRALGSAVSDSLAPGSPFTVVRVTTDQRLAAADRLVGGGEDPSRTGKRFLAAAEAHGIDLTHMWASVEGSGRSLVVRQVALAVPGTGRTAMVFTSAPRTPAQQEELGAVIDRACAGLTSTMLAQALLESHEKPVRQAFVHAGFRDVGTLAYLRRPVPKAGEFARVQAWPAGVAIRNWRPGDDALLGAALEESYEATLDCPELCGLRDTGDVIASHRGTGTFDPKLWWIVMLDGRPAGAMLFNPSPEQGSIELVYIGLSPALRGRGVGRQLVVHGLAHLCGRREAWINCAVDRRNTPAMKLYDAIGFRAFAERMALVRPLRTPRGQSRPEPGNPA